MNHTDYVPFPNEALFHVAAAKNASCLAAAASAWQRPRAVLFDSQLWKKCQRDGADRIPRPDGHMDGVSAQLP